jgi:hypothetical protein
MLMQELLEGEQRLVDLLPQLDHLLTGNPMAKTIAMARQQPNLLDPLELIMDNDAYYLSDGGYSRVLVRDVALGLSGVSRAEVKARWHDPAVQHVVQQINLILRAAYDDAMKSS